MAKIFGFDLGVASIGWAAIEMSDTIDEGQGFVGSKILGCGVRCFTAATNAADRRVARGMRRRLRHRALRMHQIRALLRSANLIDIPEPKKNGHNNFYLNRDTDTNIWRLRAVDAFQRKLTPRETGRILYHMAKHRGYDDITYPVGVTKPADADSPDTKEELKAIGCIADNFALLRQSGKDKTMCQVLYLKNPAQMRNKKKTITKISAKGEAKTSEESTYTNSIPRSEIFREARMILAAQKTFGNDFTAVFDVWYPIASRQRKFNESDSPLYRSVASMRGVCKFTGEPVAPKESPSAQLFVALSTCSQNGLIPDQIELVLAALYKKKTGLKYSDVRKLLKLDDDYRFKTLNYSRKYDKEQKNWIEPKISDVEKVSFGKPFSGYHTLLPFTDNIDLMDKIYEILATEKTPDYIKRALSAYLPEHADVISQLSTSGFLNLSLSALQKLIPEMRGGKTYAQACEVNNWDHRSTGDSFIDMSDDVANGMLHQIDWSVLGKRLTSPVARRTLSQLRRVYNAMVYRYGAPDKIHLEIGRELKKSPKELAQLQKENERNRVANEAAHQEHGKNAKKYKLYMEQDCKCPYCGASIDANNWDAYEIDHILPYSRSLDNSQSNKVLVCRTCNQSKGSKTPYEYLDQTQFYEMTVRARSYHNMTKFKKLTNMDLPPSNDEQNGFIARNANDNATIARFATQYLTQGIKWPQPNDNKLRVLVRTGALTDYLRHQWGLSKNREESDKHHAQDAIVIACATQDMVRYLSTLSGKFENKTRLIGENGEAWYASLKKSIQSPWPKFRDSVVAALDEITVSRPPRCNATGSAHNETIYINPKSYRTKKGKNKMGAKGSMKIRFGNAVRGDMFRFDIWQTHTGKYACVPIFVSDTVSGDETKFIVPDAEFVCTLHKDDYIKIKTRADEEYEGYITQLKDGDTFKLYRHDSKNVKVVQKAVAQCAEIKKCFVTTLGNVKVVKLPEKRMPVVNKK